jgi:hypothetical protein
MEPFEVVFAGLVTFLVTWGIKGIAKQFGWNIEGKVSVLVAALAGAAVLLANAGLGLVPAEYLPVVQQVVMLVVTVLTAAGIYKARTA